MSTIHAVLDPHGLVNAGLAHNSRLAGTSPGHCHLIAAVRREGYVANAGAGLSGPRSPFALFTVGVNLVFQPQQWAGSRAIDYEALKDNRW
jgi:hypothetical protein